MIKHLRAAPALAFAAALAATNPLAAGQADAVGTDRRIELFSLLFHLAGAPEYNFGRYPAYAADVERYFAAMRNHPAVETTRLVRNQHRIGFFHPMNLAVHLTLPPELAERTPFDRPGHALGTRWPAPETRQYLEQVRAFYQDAKVDAFFEQQASLSDDTVRRLREVVRAQGDEAWFERFVGARPSTRFFVVPAFLNGNAQYGATYRDSTGAEEAYAVIGIHKLGADGRPVFDLGDADNVIHEFAHTLTGRAVTGAIPQLAEAGPALFAPVRDLMREQAYGEWETMVHEAVVRAVVVRFIAARRGDDAAQAEIAAQEKLGFRQTGALAGALEAYERARDRYPTFADVVPEIVAVLQRAAR